jgi:hypothetical protein
MNRILLIAAATLAAAVLVPSAAQASTLHQDSRTPHKVLLQDDAGVPTCMPLDAHMGCCDNGTGHC